MFYYMYQITNKVNNKIYVGVHKTKNLDDGYMGSGKVIRYAIDKHGIENFEKVILEFFGTAKAMYAREKEVVDDEFLLREDVYNLTRGGHGSFEHINKSRNFSEHNAKIAKIRDYTSIEYREKLRCAVISGMEKIVLPSRKGQTPTKGTTGLSFSEETKTKMSIAASGENSSQYGTIWITNGICSKKIKSTEQIPAGYKRGRK